MSPVVGLLAEEAVSLARELVARVPVPDAGLRRALKLGRLRARVEALAAAVVRREARTGKPAPRLRAALSKAQHQAAAVEALVSGEGA